MPSASGSPEADHGPAIALYATGGTIASSAELNEPVEPRLTAARLVDAVPGLAAGERLRLVDFRQAPSVELMATDMVALTARLAADADEHVEGFVVTQGTDTLEEFAFGLDLLWDRAPPVVVTGAMRAPEALGADGPANLAAAIAVASSLEARSAGCLVVLNDEIHAARHVRKAHATSPAAFESPLCGPVGGITEGRVRLWNRPVRPPSLPLPPSSAPQPPVALIRVSLGDDARIVSTLVEQGYRGAVVESMGSGHVPRCFVAPLADLSASIPVVLVSRAGPSELLRRTYGFPGSETELFAAGLLPAGILDGLKARIKLTLALMTGASRPDVEAAFRAESEPIAA